MRSKLLLLFLGFVCLTVPVVLANTSFNVGIDIIALEDTNRAAWGSTKPRPIVSHIFYPTNAQRTERILIGAPGKEVFDAGEAVWAAPPAGSDKRPLIVLSHGTGGSALQLLWLAQALVKQGYVVLGVNHHGNTAMEAQKSAAAYILWWERAQDLNVALEQLLADTKWSERIDASKVAVGGFSLGGYSAISAVGGITDTSLFNTFCESEHRDATCEPQLEFPDLYEKFESEKESQQVKDSFARQHSSYANEKFKAAFVIAPAVAQSFSPESLAAISVPVIITTGSDDQVAPVATSAQYLTDQIKDAPLAIIPRAGHYTFLSACTEFGAKVLGPLCMESPGTTRGDKHQEVSSLAVRFFDQVFKSKSLLSD